MKLFSKRILSLIFLFASAYGIKYFSQSDLEPFSAEGGTMGTTYSYKVYANGARKEEVIAKDILQILDTVNIQMSTYIPTSEISRFNQSKSLEKFKVSTDFFKVLMISKEVYDKTKGAFDPTIAALIKLWGFAETDKAKSYPSEEEIEDVMKTTGFNKLRLHPTGEIQKTVPGLELNLSAIAKGFAVDQVARYLRSFSRDFLIEIGGEVYAQGKNAGKKWKVGVEKPDETKRIVKEILELDGQCVASSGNYRNFYSLEGRKVSHTISPKTGKPVQQKLLGVTVLAKECVLADAYATSLMVMGKTNSSLLGNKLQRAYFFEKE